MIHYALQCDHGHGFDGWFKDSLAFDQQAATGLIACPSCNSTGITRALMAPALGRSAKHGQPAPAASMQTGVSAPDDKPLPTPAAAKQPPQLTGHTIPEPLREFLHKLRTEVESQCDYVGSEFAEEARKIHYGETDVRGIYGEATRDEAEALAEEGIEFGTLPWVTRRDS